ncbi:MAG TPA: prenyltransferase/squalene oxidase repeat-containing protein [Candidatus Binatia bacterium]|nr:prenyltransferase/squalene oxidase repeat-containing protein [Candidatus Binatia bacterium]
MIQELTTLLLNNQNPDGGWGSSRGKASNTEVTSLAVMALAALNPDSKAEHYRRGVTWLAQRQATDGSWPLSDGSKLPSWSTAMAMLALGISQENQIRAVKAAKWVLRQEGNRPSLLAKFLFALSFKKRAELHLNIDLVGWPWLAGNFSWVEPTSYYVIALKALKSRLAGVSIDERIKQGELMIYDRMCQGGGWNYGNSAALGEDLWPYPDITALALIALQDHPEKEANRQSLQALKAMLKDVNSGLALSWSIICLSLYGEDTSEWKNYLEQSFRRTQFLGETKSVALSLLALGDGVKFFKI